MHHNSTELIKFFEINHKCKLHKLCNGDIMNWNNRKKYKLDDDGQIVGLNLSDCNIQSMSFPHVLSSLRKLNLSRSNIHNWNFLKHIPNIDTLVLRSCNIVDASFIGSIPKLCTLDLSMNRISDWNFLDIPNLNNLSISSTGIEEVSFLRHLPCLKSLDISNNNILDVSCVKDMLGLMDLKVLYCPLRDLSCVSKLKFLESIQLGGTNILDGSLLANLPNLKKIELRSTKISDWSFIADIGSLESLCLWNNEIFDISLLRHLKLLKTLMLRSNRLANHHYLNEFNMLTELQLMNCSINNYSFLSNLTQLASLDIRNSSYLTLKALIQYYQLHSLVLSKCKVDDWHSLKHCQSVVDLDISLNGLTDTSFLKYLTYLRTLILHSNAISDLTFLEKLHNLTTVDIRNNKVRDLPESVLNLNIDIEPYANEVLPQSFTVLNNPFESPPLEIVKDGNSAIMSWFNEQKVGVIPLNECKVIFLGEGSAGKTSLRKRLMGEPVNHRESQTHGIDIRDHTIVFNDDYILVHFWDFGGQEILHATHQFFLSRRSLYIVVLDGRKDEDADYWLKLIESFGGESPILICLNKVDEHPGFEVNRKGLQEKYKGIRAFYRLNCLDPEDGGVTQILKDLPKNLLNIDLTRSNWPKRWFQVKEVLQTENKPFIEREDFESICRNAQVHDEVSQATLIRFLNDLGIALHFEDDRLNLLQILNPRWATQAVYRIVTSPIVAQANGLLSFGDLRTILKKTEPHHFEYPQGKRDYLIDLMRKFELCFDVARNQILLPDLLGVEEPNFKFDSIDIIRFRFVYDFMPASILPRFIVQRHTEIDGNNRWRTGVILKPPEWNATARIRADKNSRNISIEVAGPNRRDYFAVIRQTFETIHSSFTKLDVKRKVPLPDRPDTEIDYYDLRFHEEKKRKMILVGVIEKEYDVKKLLDGIEPIERRRARKSELVNSHTGQGNMTVINNIIKDNTGPVNFAFGKNITQATADSIRNSFNQADEAKSLELQSLLKQLACEVSKIAEEQPADKAQETAEHLETFTKQATAEKRTSYWEISKKGIIDAAQAVSAVGGTAIGLVKKITDLLGSVG